MPDSLRSVNEFITGVYETVLDGGKWSDILDDTARMAGAKAANVCLVDHVAEELNSQFMCSETSRFYPVYMGSPHMEVELKAVARLPQVQTTATFCETGAYVRKANEAFPDDPIDLGESEDWLFNEWSVRTRYISRLNIQPSYLDLHTLLFGELSEAKRLEGTRRIEMLTPHFAKAVEISRPFLLLKSRFQATLDVLDRFHLAVFILSSTGTVVLRNAAADRILDADDGLTLGAGGRLKSESAAASPGVDALVSDVLDKRSRGDVQHSTEFIVKRRSRGSAYLGEITPLSEPTVLGRVSGLMIIMIDPDHRKIINTGGMGKLFGLSKAEDNICQLLTNGHSTDEIADIRGVSPVTVKNQVKAVLSKTGNRNRSDLIRQALSINLPVDGSAQAGSPPV